MMRKHHSQCHSHTKFAVAIFLFCQLLYWQHSLYQNRNLEKIGASLHSVSVSDEEDPSFESPSSSSSNDGCRLPPELHAVILWRGQQDLPIAQDLLKSEAKEGRSLDLLKILDLSKIGESKTARWCHVMYAGGRHSQPRCRKEGRGQPFPLVLVVKDHHPTYEWHKSGHPDSPPQYMNTKLRNYKKLLRNAIAMHPSFLGAHSSTNVEEAVAALEVLQEWMPKAFKDITPKSLRPEVAPSFDTLEQAIAFSNSYGCTRTAQTGLPHDDNTPFTDVFTTNYFQFKIITGAHATFPNWMREVGRKDTTSTAAWLPLTNERKHYLQVRSLDDGHVPTKWLHDALDTAQSGLMAPMHAGFLSLFLLHTYAPQEGDPINAGVTATERRLTSQEEEEEEEARISPQQAEFISQQLNGVRLDLNMEDESSQRSVPMHFAQEQILNDHVCVRMALYLFMKSQDYELPSSTDTKKGTRAWWQDFGQTDNLQVADQFERQCVVNELQQRQPLGTQAMELEGGEVIIGVCCCHPHDSHRETEFVHLCRTAVLSRY